MEKYENLVTDLTKELKNILVFWAEHTIDQRFGGFAGEVDAKGNIVPHADKGLVLNTRILWTFSAAFNFFRDPAYLELAERAFDYLLKHFSDQKNGGFFWAVDYKGNVVNDRKQVYGQGFAIYAFSEYFKASGKRESLDHAIQLFDLLDKYSYDPVHGGYLEALSACWNRMDDVRLSTKDANCPKSMNTHLHILEPFSNLYRVWPTDVLHERMQSLIRVFLDRILNNQSHHFHLFFDEEWRVQSNMVSYGHDIEGAWLINEAADLIGDEMLRREAHQKTLQMVDAVLKDGLAPDHSLYYEKDLDSGNLQKDRHWWVQAEALVGLMDAFENSGDPKYFERFLEIWRYIRHHMIDQDKGGWFGIIEDNGLPGREGVKAGFWKCPYHNTRALMETIQRIRHMHENRFPA
ncbi:MAG: AGE family epimerase/isomerase [Marinilabilia sp.]